MLSLLKTASALSLVSLVLLALRGDRAPDQERARTAQGPTKAGWREQRFAGRDQVAVLAAFELRFERPHDVDVGVARPDPLLVFTDFKVGVDPQGRWIGIHADSAGLR